jgi:hypothetical protein
LFPEPSISVGRYDLLNAVGIILLSKLISEQISSVAGIAWVCRFRPTEKNRLVKNILLKKEGQKQTSVQKSTIEEENVPLVCYTCF